MLNASFFIPWLSRYCAIFIADVTSAPKSTLESNTRRISLLDRPLPCIAMLSASYIQGAGRVSRKTSFNCSTTSPKATFATASSLATAAFEATFIFSLTHEAN